MCITLSACSAGRFIGLSGREREERNFIKKPCQKRERKRDRDFTRQQCQHVNKCLDAVRHRFPYWRYACRKIRLATPAISSQLGAELAVTPPMSSDSELRPQHLLLHDQHLAPKCLRVLPLASEGAGQGGGQTAFGCQLVRMLRPQHPRLHAQHLAPKCLRLRFPWSQRKWARLCPSQLYTMRSPVVRCFRGPAAGLPGSPRANNIQ